MFKKQFNITRCLSGFGNKQKENKKLTLFNRVAPARLAAVLGGVLIVGLLLAACPATSSGDNGNGGGDGGNGNGGTDTTYPYICTNGTPVAQQDATADNITKCQSCTTGYVLTAAETCNWAYTCNNGTASTDGDATADNINKCASCHSGYALFGQACALDNDNDGVANITDVDDDNDGLIEIFDLTMLHNMRYNLAGTGYTTASDGTPDTAGAPTATTKAPDYACSSTGLCGYELTQSLTFDKDGDGKTFEADGSGGYTLDNDDNAAPYFVVANDGTGGWLPIGYAILDDTHAFTAIFEGNGHTIRHLAIIRNESVTGMFAYIDSGAHIRNIGLLSTLADYNGTANNRAVGGLVGYQLGGTIIASYADVTADNGSGAFDTTGGLVGTQSNGSIVASHATGSVNGGADGNDYTGGLVGQQLNGTIIASYATSEVNGGPGGMILGDISGGLVGNQSNGTIVASYATGSVNGGAGNFQNSGGLVGAQGNATIVASYATGNVDGGSGTNQSAGKLIGSSTGGSHTASYGFGTATNVDTAGIDGSTRPLGVNSAVSLTSSNVAGCIGIENRLAYLTRDACTAATKAPCSWSTFICGGTVAGINCVRFGSPETCNTTSKSPGVWNGDAWNSATSSTAGAWDFGAYTQLPALKYADYDGAGTDYSCDMFPAGKCNTLIPGQR